MKKALKHLLIIFCCAILFFIASQTVHIVHAKGNADVSTDQIEECLSTNGVDHYAYMDYESAPEELKPLIIEARNKIIFSTAWVADGASGYIADKDGNIIKSIPEFSENFPSDWEYPFFTTE